MKVYWPADMDWYTGEVKAVDHNGRSYVEYDDSQIEVLHFAMERFELESVVSDSAGALWAQVDQLKQTCLHCCYITDAHS